MGTWVTLEGLPDEIESPDHCGEVFDDLEVGDRIRVRIALPIPDDPEAPLVATRAKCWNGYPEKVHGPVTEVERGDDGAIRGLVVLRTLVVVTDRTEIDD